MQGVDVSNNNSVVDWHGVEFAFYKATEGATFIDATQSGFAATSRLLPHGPYHFAHPDANSADVEAAHFLAYAIPGTMWALDCETRTGKNPLAVMGAAALAAWCDRFFDLVAPHLGPGYHYTFRSYADQLWPRLTRPWRWWLATAVGKPSFPVYAGRTVDVEQWGQVAGVDQDFAYTNPQEQDLTPDEHNMLVKISQWEDNITDAIQVQTANAITSVVLPELKQILADTLPGTNVTIDVDALAAKVADVLAARLAS
jgi:Glycosyl hydrolases family 25